MRRLRPRASASRAPGPDGLGGVRGGAAEARRLSRPLRRLPRAAGFGLEDLPGPLRQQQILGERECGGSSGRDPCLCRSADHPPGRARRRRASAQLRARRGDLRSVALRPGAGPQARRSAQRRAVQALGAAGRLGAGAPQARRIQRWRSPDGRHPRRRADGWIARGRGRLRAGDDGQCSFVRRDPQHPRPPPRSRPDRDRAHAGCADAAACAHRRRTVADGARYDQLSSA